MDLSSLGKYQPPQMTSQPPTPEELKALLLEQLQMSAAKPEVKAPAAANAWVGMKPQPRTSNTKKTTSSLSTTTNTLRPMDEASAYLQQVADLPFMKEQSDAIHSQDDMLKMQNQELDQAGESAGWIKPLAALTDAQTGSNFSAQYKSPVAARQDKLNSASDNLLKRRADYNSTLLGSLTKMQEGKKTQLDSNMLANMIGLGTGSMLGETRRNKLISDAGGAFDKDVLLKQMNTTYNNLNRAESLLNGKAPITSKSFNLLQQDFINAMAPGGAATEGKVNREMISQVAGFFNDLNQKFGTVEDLRKDPGAMETIAQLKQMLHQVREDYQHATDERVGDIAANYADVPDEAVQSTVARKVERYKTRTQPKTEAAPTGPVRMKAPDGTVRLVPQDQAAAAEAAGGVRL